MVPFVDLDPGSFCVELPGGRVVDWDPEGTSEGQSADGWERSFREVARDVEPWLGAWVGSPTPNDEREAERAQLHREELRRTHERIAAMTPEEREEIGLPADDRESAIIDEAKP